MTHYRLRYVLHPPSEDTGWKFMAEVPVLPGCQAWADTPQETIEILTSVAEEFIASYKEHGDRLPDSVTISEFKTDIAAHHEQNSEGRKYDAMDSQLHENTLLVAS